MSKRPVVSGAAALRAFEPMGFRVVRQPGSHVVVRKDSASGSYGTTVPMHNEIARGTLAGILRQAGVEMEDFLTHLEK